MLYTYRELYVHKEEYIKILSTDNINEALKILQKDFTIKIVKSFGEKPISLNFALEIVDSYHINLISKLITEFDVREYALSVDSILSTYTTITALMSVERGFRPVTYLPGLNPVIIEDYISGKRSQVDLNPYSEFLIKTFINHKELKVEEVLKIYDRIRRDVFKKVNYRERIVIGFMYDLVLLRLCTIKDFRDVHWRPIIITEKDFSNICRLVTADLLSALDLYKKTRPLAYILSSIAFDVYKILNSDELLDFIIPVGPAYLSNLILRTEKTSIFLKDYFATLRQVALLRLALTLIHLRDESLKSALKTFIERWVSP